MFNSSISNIQMQEQLKACMDSCLKCLEICNDCYIDCCNSTDPQKISCIQLLRDCSEICMITHQFLSRESVHTKLLVNLCGTICEACAKVCSAFEEECYNKCVEACKQCTDYCLSVCCS